MKKTIALILSVVMMLVLTVVPAFAATISVTNVIDGETYTAYKILNYTNSGDAYSYYLTASEYTSIGSVLEGAGFAFTQSADGTQYFVNNAGTIDVAAAAAYLKTNVSSLGDALGKSTATGANGAATFDNLATGYYFVTSSAGSLAALHSETDIATAVEKNTITTEDKKQGSAAGTYNDAQLDLNIGDTVYYSVEITIGTGADQDIVLTDTLSSGLTLNQDSIEVKIGSTDVAAANYTVTDKTAQGFKLTLKDTYVKTLAAGTKVVVTYSAVINSAAVIDGANTNEAKLEYSNQSQTDTTVVKTYDVNLLKKDGEGADANALAGAEFNLYTEQTGGTALKFSKDNTGYYLDATNGAVKIEAGDGTGVNIRGLAPGTYYLEETVAPSGYNKLSARVPVTVAVDATGAATVTVVNTAGVELPSTGGIGTKIFIAVGAVIAVAAAVVIVTNKRAKKEAI